jgi:hypothetical protein
LLKAVCIWLAIFLQDNPMMLTKTIMLRLLSGPKKIMRMVGDEADQQAI